MEVRAGRQEERDEMKGKAGNYQTMRGYVG